MWDVIVGNPPYGTVTKYTHFKVMNTVLKFCTDKLCFIMPSIPTIRQTEEPWYSMLKKAVCTNIEIQDEKLFKGTNMEKTAIYFCDRKEKEENYCKKLDVEDTLYSLISDEGKLFVDGMQKFYNKGNKNIKIFIGWDIRNKDTYYKLIKPDHYYLNVSRANGGYGAYGASWFSNKLENVDIFDTDEEINDLKERKNRVNIIECPNKQYGLNLKNLMINYKVLRYGLWLKQYGRDMYQQVFTYVPAIDYTTIDTDEKLLSACEFSDDEIRKILNYLATFNFNETRNDSIQKYSGEIIKSPVEQKKIKSTLYFSATDEENSEADDTVEPDSSPSSSGSLPIGMKY